MQFHHCYLLYQSLLVFIATVMNHHKHCGLQQHKWTLQFIGQKFDTGLTGLYQQGINQAGSPWELQRRTHFLSFLSFQNLLTCLHQPAHLPSRACWPAFQSLPPCLLEPTYLDFRGCLPALACGPSMYLSILFCPWSYVLLLSLTFLSPYYQDACHYIDLSG